MNAGAKALVISLILGGIMIYAVGGFASSDAPAVAWTTAAGFFVFWLALILFGSPPKPHNDAIARDDGDARSWWH